MSSMNNLGVLGLQWKCGFISPETENGTESICLLWSGFPQDEVLTPCEVADSPQHKRTHPASGGSGRNTHRPTRVIHSHSWSLSDVCNSQSSAPESLRLTQISSQPPALSPDEKTEADHANPRLADA